MPSKFNIASDDGKGHTLVAEGVVAWCPKCQRLLNQDEVMPVVEICIDDKMFINRAFHSPGCKGGTAEVDFRDPSEFPDVLFEVQDEDQDEDDDTEGQPCRRHAYCCTISPRCEDCPEQCKDLVCPHWKKCNEYTPGTPEPRKCSKCGNPLKEDEQVMAWKINELDQVDTTYAFCNPCTSEVVGGTRTQDQEPVEDPCPRCGTGMNDRGTMAQCPNCGFEEPY